MAKQPEKPQSKGGKAPEKSVPVKTQTPEVVPSWERNVDPFFDRMFDRFFGDFHLPRWPGRAIPGGRDTRLQIPVTDVYEEKGEVVIKAELPGISKEDLEVTVSGSLVTIKGEKKKEEEVKDKDYHRWERSYGSFSRTIELPGEIKPDAVKASFKDGVLEIRLPKTEEARSKTTTVKVA